MTSHRITQHNFAVLSSTDTVHFAEWLHPVQISGRMKRALGDMSQKEAAAKLGITQAYLSDILNLRRKLSPELAAKLHVLGLDGLALFLGQAVHEYLCAAYHQDCGDPRGAAFFEVDGGAK